MLNLKKKNGAEILFSSFLHSLSLVRELAKQSSSANLTQLPEYRRKAVPGANHASEAEQLSAWFGLIQLKTRDYPALCFRIKFEELPVLLITDP